MKESRARSENIPPQHPICTLTITLPDYTGPLPSLSYSPTFDLKKKADKVPIGVKFDF